MKKKNKRQTILLRQYQDEEEEVDNVEVESIIKIQRWVKNKILTKNNILNSEEKALYERLKEKGWDAYPLMRLTTYEANFERVGGMSDEKIETLSYIHINNLPFEQLATKLRCIRTKNRKEINEIQMKDMRSAVWDRNYELEQEKEYEMRRKYGRAVEIITSWWRIHHPKFNLRNIPRFTCVLCERVCPDTQIEVCECIPKRKRNIVEDYCCNFGKCKEERLKKIENKKKREEKKNKDNKTDEPELTEEYLMKQTKKRLRNLFDNNNKSLSNWAKAKKELIVGMILKHTEKFTIIDFD